MSYRDLFALLGKKKHLFFDLTVLGILAAALLTLWLVPAASVATATVCVRNKAAYPDGISASDLSASEALVEPAIAAMKMPDLFALTAAGTNGFSEESLAGAIAFEPIGGGLIRVTLTAETEARASDGLTIYLSLASETVPSQVNAGSLSLIGSVYAERRDRPFVRNAVVGAACGFVFAAGCCLVSRAKKEPEN